MIFRFPFRWGPAAPPTTVTPTVTSAATWTRIYASGTNWGTSGGDLLPRFQHVYQLPDSTTWTKDDR